MEGKQWANTAALSEQSTWAYRVQYGMEGYVKPYLYPSITVIRGHNSILGEHKVDGATGLPTLQIDCHRGVGLSMPLGYFLKAIKHISYEINMKII